jgi:hypothetical protein
LAHAQTTKVGFLRLLRRSMALLSSTAKQRGQSERLQKAGTADLPNSQQRSLILVSADSPWRNHGQINIIYTAISAM